MLLIGLNSLNGTYVFIVRYNNVLNVVIKFTQFCDETKLVIVKSYNTGASAIKFNRIFIKMFFSPKGMCKILSMCE